LREQGKRSKCVPGACSRKFWRKPTAAMDRRLRTPPILASSRKLIFEVTTNENSLLFAVSRRHQLKKIYNKNELEPMDVIWSNLLGMGLPSISARSKRTLTWGSNPRRTANDVEPEKLSTPNQTHQSCLCLVSTSHESGRGGWAGRDAHADVP